MSHDVLHLNLFKNLLTPHLHNTAPNAKTETKSEASLWVLQEQRKCQRWFSFSAGVWVIFCSQLNNSALRPHGRPVSVRAGLSWIHSELSSDFRLSRLSCWSCSCSGLSQSAVCCDATSVSNKLREYVTMQTASAILWGPKVFELELKPSNWTLPPENSLLPDDILFAHFHHQSSTPFSSSSIPPHSIHTVNFEFLLFGPPQIPFISIPSLHQTKKENIQSS